MYIESLFGFGFLTANMGDLSLEWYKLRNRTQKEMLWCNMHLSSSSAAALCYVGIHGQRKPFQFIPLNEWKVKAERWNAAKRVWSACCREMWSFGEGGTVDWNSFYRYFYFLNENDSADLVLLSERSGTIQQFMLTVTWKCGYVLPHTWPVIFVERSGDEGRFRFHVWIH